MIGGGTWEGAPMPGMRRREFITLFGGAAVAWPLAARAQQVAMPVIGWLSSETRGAEEYRVAPFRQGLNEAGYIEGQNVAVEYRFAGGEYNDCQHWPPIWFDARLM